MAKDKQMTPALLEQYPGAEYMLKDRVLLDFLNLFRIGVRQQDGHVSRQNPDDVYNDIQEAKAEAAAWMAEDVEL